MLKTRPTKNEKCLKNRRKSYNNAREQKRFFHAKWLGRGKKVLSWDGSYQYQLSGQKVRGGRIPLRLSILAYLQRPWCLKLV